MKHLPRLITRHKVAIALMATALVALCAAIGAVWFSPRGSGLESFMEPASKAHHDAESLFESNQTDNAEVRCRQAIDILDRVPAQFHDDENYRFERGAAFETLGSIHIAKDRPDKAVDDFQQTIDMWVKVLARNQHEIEVRKRVASCTARLTRILVKLGRWDDAEKVLDRGDSVCQTRAVGLTPDPWIDQKWVEILNQRGIVFLHKGKWSKALEDFKNAERVQKGLIQPGSGTGEDRERLIKTVINESKAHTAANQPVETERTLVEARDLAEHLRADFPTTPRYQDLAATTLDTLADLIRKDPKRISEARGLLEKALSIRESFAANPDSVPEYFVRMADTCSSLGELFIEEKSFNEAETCERKALLYSARLEKEHPSNLEFRFEHGRARHNLADFLRERGRSGEAMTLERQAIERLVAVYKENVLDPDHRRALSYAYWALCTLELGRGDYRAAAAAVDEYQKIEPGGYEEAYESARFLCRAIPLCLDDQLLSATKRESLARSYADRAIAALETASQNGFHDLKELTTSHTYDPLRGRPEFARILTYVSAIAEALNEKQPGGVQGLPATDKLQEGDPL
jgi:tetratricopeptide (TPR) repeat protein